MKILIASDSFKGCMDTIEIADAVASGFRRVDENVEVIKVPIADGGEGTLDAILSGSDGEKRWVKVEGPLGEKIDAAFGIIEGNIAIIEMAQASGITKVHQTHLSPYEASTYGTGELIKAALDAGCRKFYIGIGGSATNDGGAGMAEALGAKFLSDEGDIVARGGAALRKVHQIDLSMFDQRIYESEITVLSDVDNPLCGEKGASYVYGPQKGATPEMCEVLDQALSHFGTCIYKALNKDVMHLKGAGAAGGLGAGLVAFCNATLKPGVDSILELFELDKHMNEIDLIITGEGMMDHQTAFGKAPMGVGQFGKSHGVPVIAIVGSIGQGIEAVYEVGIHAVFSIVNAPMSLEASIENAPELIAQTAENIARLLNMKK